MRGPVITFFMYVQLFNASRGGEIINGPLTGGYILAAALCSRTTTCNEFIVMRPLGGHRPRTITYSTIAPYIPKPLSVLEIKNKFCFVAHAKGAELNDYLSLHHMITNIPLEILVSYIPLATGQRIAELHGMSISQPRIALLQTHFKQHVCDSGCIGYRTIISVVKNNVDSDLRKKEQDRLRAKSYRSRLLSTKEECEGVEIKQVENEIPFSNTYTSDKSISGQAEKMGENDIFPPTPLDKLLSNKILKSACDAMNVSEFEESGCAVCGQLVLLKNLSRLSAVTNLLHILSASGVTRKERFVDSDAIMEYSNALDLTCDKICNDCRSSLRKNKVPRFALAKGLWLGNVPEVLSSLRFVERMLVARIRHSSCCVRIASGMRKMKANAIAFQTPIPVIFNILPPAKDDIEEVLAIMFTGPCKPTSADFKRTPFLVRRNHVRQALEWLKLNHRDYADIVISEKHLNEYHEDMPPVSITYKTLATNKTPEGMSVFDDEEEDGTAEGDCAFTVHGLTGDDLNTMTTYAIKARALQHLNNEGKLLAVGHAEEPESIWANPKLYPQMFPWLFPYGLGGIGTVKYLGEVEHKRRLLMYHDKRFQTDPTFPFVAFSHAQIKASTSQSFLLAEKRIFQDITSRLLSLDMSSVNSLIQRLANDEGGKAETDEEKKCYQIIRDLDHVQGKVKGSITNKKWMRNEIWSLINHCGAPFWYITLSPADVKHPICIYYASKCERLQPDLKDYEERLRLICANPVAGARFFHFIVKIFIKHILGVNGKQRGLYGKIKAYYGTVEQQGRLTLHLHMLLWLMGNLTPEEMKQRILDPKSDFQKKIIDWIESCQIGEFLTGTKEEVMDKVKQKETEQGYKDPTETMALPPPQYCKKMHSVNVNCSKCNELNEWWTGFNETVDDLICKSNIHNCERGRNKDGSRKSNLSYVGCKDNKYGKCKARFPRPTYDESHIDMESASINIKKKEAWINTLTPAVTYLFRCNTDVTCLWSGTALKAVVLYVSDYITKSGLKTHVVFEVIKSIFERNLDILNGDVSDKEKARKLINKTVNMLSTKNEMGAPMVCMYLLGNPDHYTSHVFVPFYWKTYVDEVYRTWYPERDDINAAKLTLLKQQKKIIGLSPVDDYIFRPSELENMCLYDWRRCCKRLKLPRNKKNAFGGDENADMLDIDANDNILNSSACGENDIEDEDYEMHSASEDNATINKSLPKSLYRFLRSHPLYNSHGCVTKCDYSNVVANFISILPRSDKGDREDYCLTMLVLFKPWRDPLKLKEVHSTWDETFLSHPFTDRQVELMKNFNIKYECLDARDDYNAQLKKDGIMSFFAYGEEIEENDDEFDPEKFGNSGQNNGNMGCEFEDNIKLGRTELRRKKEAEEIRNVLFLTGWSRSVKNKENLESLKAYQPSVALHASEWKGRVQAIRQHVVDKKKDTNRTSDNNISSTFFSGSSNIVKVVDKSYLEKRFYRTEHESSIQKICMDFKLNEEQRRAFEIVAHHVVFPHSDQLKMYIGGIGGTGKSQVIKAITEFFNQRGEAFRFIIVAPTGSAAALLGGATYHSVLGINEKSGGITAKQLTQIRTKLNGVDYFFLDEVSMLSAYELYKISVQLCRVMNKPDVPFGGVNMLWAGDFGQLPPAMGGESVSLYSRTIGTYAKHLRSQEEAMGRSLWHQVTTVVILRKNMRQQKKSSDDDSLRRCLNNMRYKDCTAEDIKFLRKLVTSSDPLKASVCDPEFRNIAIITAKNAQKDEINRIGCVRFAEETNQRLTTFYSDDSLQGTHVEKEGKKQSKNKRSVAEINENLQKYLWDIPHSSADKQIPGKLSLCVGLPVMIKCNVATELCITNGQEATVVGWQSKKGSRGQLMIDTLFLELKNPPTSIQIDDLEENVVPMICSSNTITCSLPDDTKINICRTQVEVLPNFAMTDFASQGKTRPFNPVDLNNCRSHQAFYTALSRSASAAGTIILQGFDSKKITGKASGALRQEFRDLELLDEITKLRHLNKLQTVMVGESRNDLIQSYRAYKGMSYVPENVHESIKWSDSDPMLDPIMDAIGWKVVTEKGISADSTPDIKKGVKRQKDDGMEVCGIKKKRKLDKQGNGISETIGTTPVGFAWYKNSCAYDCVLGIILAIWKDNKEESNLDAIRIFNSNHMKKLFSGFEKALTNVNYLGKVRDRLRLTLQKISKEKFPWGGFTGTYDILNYILATNETAVNSIITCPHNTFYCDEEMKNGLMVAATEASSVRSWLANWKVPSNYFCEMCHDWMPIVMKICRHLPMIALDFSNKKPRIDFTFEICIDNVIGVYILRGVIYFGEAHYTSRILNEDGNVWFHDGIATGNSVIYEGNLGDSNIVLEKCRGKMAYGAIYSKKS